VDQGSEDRFGEDVQNAGDQVGIVGEPVTQSVRKRKDPLPHGNGFLASHLDEHDPAHIRMIGIVGKYSKQDFGWGVASILDKWPNTP
jgi:hypothetical protein